MNKENRDFKKEYDDARAEYYALGLKIAEVSNRETTSFKETIRKINKISALLKKRMNLESKQRKRARDEVMYNKANGIDAPMPPTSLGEDF